LKRLPISLNIGFRAMLGTTKKDNSSCVIAPFGRGRDGALTLSLLLIASEF
jgi:hypothetical protein